MSAERVFVFDGTGSIGSQAVQGLLEKNIPVTLYARSPEKAEALFNSNSLVSVVQGDYSDLTALKIGIQGHSRLFLQVSDFANFVQLKAVIAKIAYDAGVKQIVDISSFTASRGWRICCSSSWSLHVQLSKFDHSTADGKIFDTAPADHPQAWISANDIGAVATVVLSDNISKHADAVYALYGYVCTPAERVEILSRVTGREITYHQLSFVEKYKQVMKLGHFPHFIAYDLCAGELDTEIPHVSGGIEILLGRAPETLEEYLIPQKDEI